MSLLPALAPEVRRAVEALPYALQEWWQERAGMRQAEGESRDEAERKALADVTRGR